jgi:hypothetical protein
MVVDQDINSALNRIADAIEGSGETLKRIADHDDGVVPVMTRNAKRAEAFCFDVAAAIEIYTELHTRSLLDALPISSQSPKLPQNSHFLFEACSSQLARARPGNLSSSQTPRVPPFREACSAAHVTGIPAAACRTEIVQMSSCIVDKFLI